MMKMFKQPRIIASLISLSSLAGSFSSSVAADSEVQLVPVQISKVKQTIITPTIEVMGNLYSRNLAQVTAAVDGQLDWIAEPGTYLQQGELVAKIEKLPIELQQAEQKAQLKRTQVNVSYLQKELKRLKTLRLNNITSENQYEQTLSQHDMAVNDLEIARLRLQQIDDRLDRTDIKAPFSGVVVERLRRAGEDVSRSTLLANMIDNQHLELRLSVPVKHLSFLKISNKIKLSNQQQQYTGVIRVLVPKTDIRSQTFELRIDVPFEAAEQWTVGQLIKAELPISSSRQTLAVHRDALLLRSDGTYVMVIDEKNTAHRIKIKINDGKDQWLAISGDLKEGDRVAIRGAENLREGQKVKLQTAIPTV